MAIDPAQIITVQLPAGEWNDVVARYQTSIQWSQQILAKILAQAQRQQQSYEEDDPPNVEVTTLRNKRARTAATVADGSDPAA